MSIAVYLCFLFQMLCPHVSTLGGFHRVEDFLLEQTQFLLVLMAVVILELLHTFAFVTVLGMPLSIEFSL